MVVLNERADLPRGTETVLVADDNADVRSVIARVLQGAGYAVLGAATPGEALAVCARHPGAIHLLIADALLPDMVGAELARRAAELRPALRVLYISAYTQEWAVKAGLVEGGEPFLEKPFPLEALCRQARGALDRKSGERPAVGSVPASA